MVRKIIIIIFQERHFNSCHIADVCTVCQVNPKRCLFFLGADAAIPAVPQIADRTSLWI